MPIAADLSLRLMEVLESRGRKRQEGGSFDLVEVGEHLLLGRAVNPSVSRVPFPLLQKVVLFEKACEHSLPERVLLNVIDPAFDLPLVLRRSRLRGEHRRAVVTAELLDLGVELGVKPVGSEHTGLEVVDDDRAGHTAEVLEGVLETLDEVVGRLREDGLAVASPRVRQDDPDDVGLAASAIGADDRGALTEVDLGFESRWGLHPAERHGAGRAVLLQESPHTVVADSCGCRILDQEILVDPLGRQTVLPLLEQPGEPGDRLALRSGRRTRTGQSRAGRRSKTGHCLLGPGRENRRAGRF